MGHHLIPIHAITNTPLPFDVKTMLSIFASCTYCHTLSEAIRYMVLALWKWACLTIAGQSIHLLPPLVLSTYLLCGLAVIHFDER